MGQGLEDLVRHLAKRSLAEAIEAWEPSHGGRAAALLREFGLGGIRMDRPSARGDDSDGAVESPVGGDQHGVVAIRQIRDGDRDLVATVAGAKFAAATLSKGVGRYVSRAAAPIADALLEAGSEIRGDLDVCVSANRPDDDEVAILASIEGAAVHLRMPWSTSGGLGLALHEIELRARPRSGLFAISAICSLLSGSKEVALFRVGIDSSSHGQAMQLRLMAPITPDGGLAFIAGLFADLGGSREVIERLSGSSQRNGPALTGQISLSALEIIVSDGALVHLALQLSSSATWQPWDGVTVSGLGAIIVVNRNRVEPVVFRGNIEIGAGETVVRLDAMIAVPVSSGGAFRLTIAGEIEDGSLHEFATGLMGDAHAVSLRDGVGGPAAEFEGALVQELDIEVVGGKVTRASLDVSLFGTVAFAGIEVRDLHLAVVCGPGFAIESLAVDTELAAHADDPETATSFRLSGSYDRAARGWMIGARQGAVPFTIGDFWRRVGGEVSSLPDVVRDTTVTELAFTYRSGDAAHITFDAAIDIADVATTKLHVERDPTTTSAAGSIGFPNGLAVGDIVSEGARIGLPKSLAATKLLGAKTSWKHQRVASGATKPGSTLVVGGSIDSGPVNVLAAYRRVSDDTATQATVVAIVRGAKEPALWTLTTDSLPLVGALAPSTTLFSLQRVVVVLGDKPAEPFGATPPADLWDAAMAAEIAAGPAILAVLDGGSIRVPLSSDGKSGPAPKALTAGSSSDSGWLNLDRRIGPVHLRRISAEMRDGDVWIPIDAGIQVGPVELRALGLAAKIPVPGAFDVSLRGLAIDIDTSGLRAGGSLELVRKPAELAALANRPEWGWLFKDARGQALASQPTLVLHGGVLVQLGSTSFQGAGVFARVGEQSIVAGIVNATGLMGGPPALSITGGIVGFGINTSIAAPSLDNLAKYPLLNGGKGLEQSLQVAPGASWFAAGVTFTSFRVVDASAVLLARLSDDLEFSLLGSATMRLPLKAGAGKEFAKVVLNLAASVKPREGAVAVIAVIGPGSYLLHRDCHLSGAAAYETWFGGEHAGDFVFSVGGYHPQASVPAHYPRVARIAIAWQVTPQLSLKGEQYFAMTPRQMMFGGSLDFQYRDGDLRAWLSAHLDALIDWAPFHFSVDAGIRVGVSYTVSFFGLHKTLSAELTATINLWGPPIGGRAHVDCWVISFTIDFGDRNAGAAPASWSQLRDLLPPAPLTIAWTGSLPAPATASNAAQPLIVRADDLSFGVDSSVPLTAIDVSSLDPTQATIGGKRPSVALRPMRRDAAHAVLKLRLVMIGDRDIERTLPGVRVALRSGKVPGALWSSAGEDLVEHTTGVTIDVPKPRVDPNRSHGWEPGTDPADVVHVAPLRRD